MKRTLDYHITDFAICFHGAAHHWWQRFLKKGFRHCFLLVAQSHGICLVDALAPNFKIVIFPADMKFDDIINHYQQKGCRVFYRPTKIPLHHAGNNLSPPLSSPLPSLLPMNHLGRRRFFSFGIYSCVSLIKSFLHLQKPFVITPWQLHCFLEKNNDHHIADPSSLLADKIVIKNKKLACRSLPAVE